MQARIVLVHDEKAFRDALAEALRSDGHVVRTVDDPAFKVGAPRASDELELTITRATGRYLGLRIRVTGLPAGEPYAGALGQFLAEPVTVPHVVQAVRHFT